MAFRAVSIKGTMKFAELKATWLLRAMMITVEGATSKEAVCSGLVRLFVMALFILARFCFIHF